MTSRSSRLGAALLIVAALVVAAPAAAQASTVLDPTVQLSSTASGIGGVDYLFDFTASPAGGLAANSGTITVAAPTGTVFAQNFQADLRDLSKGTDLGLTGTVSFQNGQATATWTVSSAVPAGDRLELVLPGTTNATTGGSFTISTSADTTPASISGPTLGSPQAVANPSVSLTTNVAGAQGVTYLVDFTPSSTGDLSAFNGTFTVALPNGSQIPNQGVTVTDLTDGRSLFASSSSLSNAGATATFTTGQPIPAGHLIEAAITGVTNPGSGGTVAVSTSSDPQSAVTSAFSTTPATHVTTPTVSVSTSAAGATAVTYLVDFTTSAHGALAVSNGTMTFSLPAGSVLSANFISLVDLTTGRSLNAHVTATPNQSTATYTTDNAIPAGDLIEAALPNVTNPSTGGTVSVSTSSDPSTIATNSFATTTQNAVTAPAVSLSTTTAGATGVTYLVDFTTSATGALVSGSGGFTVALPTGSVIPAGLSAQVTDLTTGQTISAGLATLGNSSATATYTVNGAIPAGDSVEVELLNVTNPGTGGNVTVSTTSDVGATASFSTTAAHAVSSPSVAISSVAPSATGVTYTVDFTASATGDLAAGNGTIKLTFPSGTVIPSAPITAVTDVTTGMTLSGNFGSVSGTTATLTIVSPLAAGHRARVSVAGITNPAGGATGATITVSTSTDTVTATTAAAATSVLLSSNAALAAGAAYTLVFSTNAPVNGTGDTINVTAPAGTNFQDQNVDVFDLTAGQDLGFGSFQSNAGGSNPVILPPSAIPSNHQIQLTLTNVTNPGVLSNQTISVAINGVSPQTTNSYSIVAAQAVSAPSLAVSSTAASATHVTYTVNATTSSSGGLATNNGTVTLALPGDASIDTNFSTLNVFDVTTDVNLVTVSGPTVVSGAATWTIFNPIPAGHRLRMTLTGVTNPSTGSGPVTVSTSSDTVTAQTNPFSTSTPNAVSGASLTASTTARSASDVTYTIGFTTSPTGGLANGQFSNGNGTITLALPGDASIASSQSVLNIYDVTDNENLASTSNPTIAGASTTWTLFSPIPAGHRLRVTVTGVTNPSTLITAPVTISTSSDTATAQTNSLTTTAPNAVSGASLVASTTARSATHVTYTIGFTTSSSGSLANGQLSGGNGTITLALPGDASINTNPSVLSVYDVTDNEFRTSTSSPTVVGANVTWTLFSAIPAGHRLRITVSAITNPSTGSGPVTVSTSSDTVSAPTNSLTTTAPQAVANPTLLVSNQAGGATGVVYTTEFTASSSGALANGSFSNGDGSVTLGFPAGASIPADQAIRVFDVSTNEDLGSNIFSPSGTSGAITWLVNTPIPAGHRVRLTLTGVTNAPGGSGQLQVSTSSDTTPAQTSAITTPPPGPQAPVVTGVSPNLGPAAGGTAVTITGTGFTGATTVKFGAATAGSVNVAGATTITATSPAGSGTVDVTVAGPGGTSATGAADQFTYQAGPPPPPPPVAPAVTGGSPTVNSPTAATVAGAVIPNGQATTAHFEYGLDPTLRQTPGPLYDQSTPAQTVGADTASHNIQANLTGLVPNAKYHYRLVAVSPAGTTAGPDQTFTTKADPAPPPVPVLGQTANVKPLGGHVFIKPPPGKTLSGAADHSTHTNLTKGNGFLPLTEARQIPSGSTIDARAGTLQLVTATGSKAKTGKTQTGIFNGGLFTNTQSASGITKGLTTLTLLADVFPGAPSYSKCTATTATAGPLTAHTARTNPILQTLHARDNHGKFRTKGRYSAGTVRGTIWDTTEQCAGTLTTVKRGTVDVFDNAKRKTIHVHAGHHYLAQPKHK